MIAEKTQNEIIECLTNCQFRQFCDSYFADKFSWTIRGTSILSGTYNDKEDFFNKVINRLNQHILPGWKMNITNHYLDNNTFIIEMIGSAKTKAGYNYNNEYCWILKFDNNKIIHLTAYYDSLLVNKTLLEPL